MWPTKQAINIYSVVGVGMLWPLHVQFELKDAFDTIIQLLMPDQGYLCSQERNVVFGQLYL